MLLTVDQEQESLPRSRWDDIDFFVYNPFHRSWAHNNLLSIKFKQLSPDSISCLKLRRDYTTIAHKDKFKLEIRLPKPDTYLCLYLIDDKFKVHYDHGRKRLSSGAFGLFGSLDFMRNGTKPNVKLGVNYYNRSLTFSNRIKIDQKYVKIPQHRI